MAGGDPWPVAVGVREFDLPSPRLVFHIDAELGCDAVDVVDPEIDQCVRRSVSGVFRKVKMSVATLKEKVKREFRCETMFVDDLESEACVPLCRLRGVFCSEDRHHFLSH